MACVVGGRVDGFGRSCVAGIVMINSAACIKGSKQSKMLCHSECDCMIVDYVFGCAGFGEVDKMLHKGPTSI